jgi:hypothetical protein
MHLMNRSASLAIIATALAAALPASSAQAQNTRSFVSARTGSDSNPCTRARPCQSVTAAIANTNAGGEVDVLDPGGYGPFGINKVISIVNDGVGTVSIRPVNHTDAITINAGPSDDVFLRGLTVEGLATSGVNGDIGIDFIGGKSLSIDHCVVDYFSADGIAIRPSTSASFSISNTTVSNNVVSGITVETTAPVVVTGVITNVQAINNRNGIDVEGTFALKPGSVNVSIVNSVASGNTGVGIGSASVGGVATTVLVQNSVTSNNKIGLYAEGAAALLRFAHSVVTGNTTGVLIEAGGIMESYGDNYIDGNGTDISGTLTTISTR